ncbi:nuclease-related domain-containing protein [Jeotgalibacillus sp. R-1-5s-1]|uniref:nuclease-related domain-containing protein n=1 Tax=Jeotgalibacillus sp. R-1-5s-1 TaxID=2555897 RepID=UPI001069CD77|nr:nuclease-related domain-containing protein [Jeotgalibacillus sp. R-1-5s-1]TFD96267.1 NERD domain-containing protein [Jeotgalibacillus sp. R-1-5s-1]
MIFHKRTPSLRASAYEILARHLSTHHPARLELLEEASLLKAGEFGEKKVTRLVQSLNQDDIHLGENLLLPFENARMQIDHLLLTPSFALIIETKHMKGHIRLDLRNEQMYRIYHDGTIKAYLHPVLQAERHREGLQDLFSKWGITLPIHTLIVFSHHDVFLEYVGDDSNLPKNVIRSERLQIKLRDLLKQNNDPKADIPKVIKKIRKSLLPEEIFSTLDHFKIQKEDIRSGIWCPACEKLSQRWIAKRFRCIDCNLSAPEAVRESLFVYLTFIKSQLTNQEGRDFLRIEAADTARRIFLKNDLIPFRKFGGTYYRYPDNTLAMLEHRSNDTELTKIFSTSRIHLPN